MKRKKASPFSIEIDKLPDYMVGDLLKIDHEMLQYIVRGKIARIRNKKKILMVKLSEILGGINKPFIEETKAQIESELRKIQEDLESLEKINGIIKVLSRIHDFQKEWEDISEDDWNKIAQLKIKDLLKHERILNNENLLHDTLLSIIRPPVKEEIMLAPTEGKIKKTTKAPVKPSLAPPKSITITERKFIMMNVEEWKSLLNESLREERQIELPRNYLTKSSGEALNALLTAMLEIPPEKIKYIFTAKKYKYLLSMHEILYNIIKEKRGYEISPNSSEREIIEGEGGIFNIFKAKQELTEKTKNEIRKTYRLKIGQQEYTIMKKILLQGRRAKTIEYVLHEREEACATS